MSTVLTDARQNQLQFCRMKRGELEHQLSKTNPWWRASHGERTWEADDPDLRAISEASFSYVPSPLEDLALGGLYVLFGPRRVGKSVELKRVISGLVEKGVDGRRVIHAACDGWRAEDLAIFVESIDRLAPVNGGPRYVILDEITAIRNDWVAQIKWLRDNSSLRADCVVLSGSSVERLDEARKAFAGRRGPVGDSDRMLLPMGFRAFCTATGVKLPALPTVHPRDMLGRDADAAIQELRAYLNELVPAWETYLEVGGFPQAVNEWNNERQVSDAFMRDLWDIVHVDALRGDWAAPQSKRLIEEIVSRLANPFVRANVAHELGVHRDALELRLLRLTRNFIAWPCYQNDGADRPRMAGQHKVYFLDPLYARLAAHRSGQAPVADYTVMTEQQIGVHLLRAHEAEDPGTLTDYDAILYSTPTRKEIDFAGGWLGSVPFEGKYVEGETWKQETLTAMSAYGRVVLATRTMVDRDGDRIAVPAAILAVLLDPTPLAVASTRAIRSERPR